MTKEIPLRECFVESKIETIISFLNPLKDQGVVNHNRAIELLPHIRGGSLQKVKKDAKVMKLINNGSTIEVTDDGKRLLHDSNKELIKDLYLRAQYFNEMYSLNIKTRNEAIKYIFERINDHYKTTLAKNLARTGGINYMVYVIGNKNASRKSRSPNKIQIQSHITQYNKDKLNFRERCIKRGISDKEMFIMMESVPKEKQHIIYEEFHR